MQQPYAPHIPQSINEIMDLLGWMMLHSPKFEDDTGYFEGQNIATEFYALSEGLKAVKDKLGPENYRALIILSDKTRAHFEADPNNETADTIRGRDCIMEMEDILRAITRRGSP